jgi:hypothetical protein
MRGRPDLRTLREIMNEVYRLFDRRCRTDTALEKLARLRRRVKRFGRIGKTLSKLFSPNLEKALTFLGERASEPLLPSMIPCREWRFSIPCCGGSDGSQIRFFQGRSMDRAAQTF